MTTIALHEIVRFSLDIIIIGFMIAIFRKNLMDSSCKISRDEYEARIHIMEDKMNTFTERFIIKLDMLTDLIKDMVDKRQ